MTDVFFYLIYFISQIFNVEINAFSKQNCPSFPKRVYSIIFNVRLKFCLRFVLTMSIRYIIYLFCWPVSHSSKDMNIKRTFFKEGFLSLLSLSKLYNFSHIYCLWFQTASLQMEVFVFILLIFCMQKLIEKLSIQLLE